MGFSGVMESTGSCQKLGLTGPQPWRNKQLCAKQAEVCGRGGDHECSRGCKHGTNICSGDLCRGA